MSERPYPWEKSYPAGVRWDAPIPTATLPELLERAVAAFGDQAAISFRGQPIGYRALRDHVDGLAAALLRLGVRRGDSIAVHLPNTPYHPIAFFAAARAGAKIVHLSPLDAEREIAYKLEDSGARLLVTTNLAGLLPMAERLVAQGRVACVLVGDDAFWGESETSLPMPKHQAFLSITELMRGQADGQAWPEIAQDEIALLQYTGGTTGKPKGAMLTHANLTAAVSIYEIWFQGLGVSEPGRGKALCVLPLFHIFGVTAVLLRNLARGREIVLHQRFDAEAVLRDIETKAITVLNGVPTMWIALISHPGIEARDLSSLRLCTSGGAPLPPEVAERFQRLTGLSLFNGYGMTETAPAGTNHSYLGPRKPGSIGLPLPGILLQVVALDDPRRVLAPGEIGELRIKGPNVMKGYWKRPGETRAAFVDGFFLTGDVGYMDADGYFFLVDRKKDMIISGGFNVYPTMVENAIYEHPDVEEAIVIGVADCYRGEAVKAFVKLRRGAAAMSLENLRAFLADKIGRHEMPAALEIREALPRTNVGKLSKLALVEDEKRRREKAPNSVRRN